MNNERMCQTFIQDGKAREILLQHVVHNAQPSALKAVLVWMYTERLEIGIDDVEAVKRIAKKCKLKSLVEALVAEQRTLRYYFKTVKREEQPRRYSLATPYIVLTMIANRTAASLVVSAVPSLACLL